MFAKSLAIAAVLGLGLLLRPDSGAADPDPSRFDILIDEFLVSANEPPGAYGATNACFQRICGQRGRSILESESLVSSDALRL